MRRLDLVVGPNGAGKTTFVQRTLSRQLPPTVLFVNADAIARHHWPDDAARHAYDAARIAAETRTKLITAGESFIAETVFSHPSKLELIDQAHLAGYAVVVHVLLVPEQLALARVLLRVRAGGHAVPEDKVVERYRRLWSLVAEALVTADESTVYDNSGAAPRPVARLVAGGIAVGETTWPEWTPAPLPATWPSS